MADIFDKITQSLGKGVEVVGIKAKQLADTNRIKGQITVLERQKQSTLGEIAVAVCAMLDGPGLDENELRRMRATVAAVDQQIAQQQNELERVNAEAELALSGQAPLAQAVGAVGGGFCTGCGKQRVAGAKFCAHCGTPASA